jgi:hypothetical protein
MINIDDDFEIVRGIDGRPVRVLKDGGRMRVSMQMRDSALREDRRRRKGTRRDPQGREEGSWEEETDDAMPLHDGRGNPCGHRPGFLISNDAAARNAKLKAQQDYTRDLENAWRNPPTRDVSPSTENPRRDAEGYAESDIGTACTCKGDDYPADFGSPGTVRRVGSRIICVPNDRRSAQPDPASDRAAAYAEYESWLRDSWKNPT